MDENAPLFPRPPFFQDAKLNFAENLLFPSCHPSDDSYAVIEANEESRNYVTWRYVFPELKSLSSTISTGLPVFAIPFLLFCSPYKTVTHQRQLKMEIHGSDFGFRFPNSRCNPRSGGNTDWQTIQKAIFSVAHLRKRQY